MFAIIIQEKNIKTPVEVLIPLFKMGFKTLTYSEYENFCEDNKDDDGSRIILKNIDEMKFM